MSRRLRIWILPATLVMACGWIAAPVWPQEPAGVAADGGANGRAARAPSDEADDTRLSDDELEALLRSLTPEQLDALLQAAVVQRLAQERRHVTAEIKQALLYDPQDVKAAVEILQNKPANTQQDNINRICRAFAKVDRGFAKPWNRWRAKDYKTAATEAEKLLDAQRTTYLSAATHYVYAASLVGSGRHEDGVEAYREILINMPDRISFASSAALRAARIYEQNHRFRYAMEMYAYCLSNYALTLSEKDADKIVKTMEEYARVYKDPLAVVAKKMGYVQTRLAAIDSGKATQEKQKEILALLEDLIRTAEEQQSGQSPQQQRPKGRSQGQARRPDVGVGGIPKGDKPTSPAKVSALVPGKTPRPPKDAAAHDTGGDGDWATLPPRRREKIRQAIRRIMSQRYRDIAGDYHTALTKTPTD